MEKVQPHLDSLSRGQTKGEREHYKTDLYSWNETRSITEPHDRGPQRFHSLCLPSVFYCFSSRDDCLGLELGGTICTTRLVAVDVSCERSCARHEFYSELILLESLILNGGSRDERLMHDWFRNGIFRRNRYNIYRNRFWLAFEVTVSEEFLLFVRKLYKNAWYVQDKLDTGNHKENYPQFTIARETSETSSDEARENEISRLNAIQKTVESKI